MRVKLSKRNELGLERAARATWIALAIDQSESMRPFRLAVELHERAQVHSARMHSSGSHEVRLARVYFNHAIQAHPLESPFRIELGSYDPSGSTALYDAIAKASELIESVQDSRDSFRLVTVITDGQDNASRSTPEEVRNRIAELKRLGNRRFIGICPEPRVLLDLGFDEVQPLGSVEAALKALSTGTARLLAARNGDQPIPSRLLGA